jgi:hypothetical protein
LAGALFPHLPLIVTGRPDPDLVRATAVALDTAIERLRGAQPCAPDGDQVRDEVAVAARLARQGAWRLLPAGDPGAPSAADRADDLAAAIDQQRVAWLGRAQPGGLADSLRHLERTLAADRAALDG